jgi:hypothetical protein
LQEKIMRGENRSTQTMFSYVSPEAMVPKDHPLRPIKAMADAALKQISAQCFGAGPRQLVETT